MLDPIVAFLQALFINALLIVVLMISMVWQKPPSPPVNTMVATTVDAQAFEIAVQQVEATIATKEAVELAEKQAIEQQMQAIAAEKMRLARLEIEQMERQRREAEERQRKAKAQIAFEKAERLRKQKALETKKREQARALEAERKRKAELEKRERARRAKEKAKAAAGREAERKATEEKRRREAQEAKRKAVKEERRRKAQEADRIAKLQAHIKKVGNLIQQKINGYWHWPSGTEHLSCKIRIFLLPGGKVAKVDILKSSGNRAFDESAVRATHDASPLPIPADLFSHLKTVKLNMDPF